MRFNLLLILISVAILYLIYTYTKSKSVKETFVSGKMIGESTNFASDVANDLLTSDYHEQVYGYTGSNETLSNDIYVMNSNNSN